MNLPDQLRYLESAWREFTKVPSEQLDEDVDISGLEKALRKRVENMDIREAQERLHQDRRVFENWVKNSGDFKAHAEWVLAFLGSRPGALVRHLLSPPNHLNEPEVTFEPPVGWAAKPFPSGIQLFKRGKELGGIWAITTSQLLAEVRSNEKRDEIESRNQNPFTRMIWKKSAVRFGECHGCKFVLQQATPTSWKILENLLEIPGGAVRIRLNANDENFDELPFQNAIHTLRISQQAANHTTSPHT